VVDALPEAVEHAQAQVSDEGLLDEVALLDSAVRGGDAGRAQEKVRRPPDPRRPAGGASTVGESPPRPADGPSWAEPTTLVRARGPAMLGLRTWRRWG
jgi:hypothetical protein